VSFPLEEEVSTKTKSLFFHEENGRRFIVYDDEINDYIRVFDLDSYKKVFDIPLAFEEYRFGFYIYNFDSIFVPVDGFKIFLIDKKGNLNQIIYYSSLKKNYPFLNNIISFSRFSGEAVNINNDIFFINPDSKLNYLEPLSPSDYHFCIRYNVRNNVISVMNITLPDNFTRDRLKKYTLSMANDGKKFIYAPLYSNEIYLSYDNSTIFDKVVIKSRFVNNLNPYYPSAHEVISMQDFEYLYCTTQRYIGFLWDKYRNVYYRFFWPGIDSSSSVDTKEIDQMFHNFPNFGIMVIDDHFNVIDEIILPMNTYSWDKYFVAKEGLYLSADNPGRKDKNRDNWTFHIYRLK